MDFTENKAAERLLKRKDETGMMSRSVASLRKEMVLMIQDIQAQSNSLFNASESLDKDATHTARAIEQVESAVGDIDFNTKMILNINKRGCIFIKSAL